MKRILLSLVIVSIAFGCTHEYDRIEMVLVEGGEFVMGSDEPEADDDEKPRHTVTLNDFYIGRFEVTQAQWKSIMRDKNPSLFIGDRLPVECVSWHDVQIFIRRLNRKTGHSYRLPTEAEWEYAAKGGKSGSSAKFSGSYILQDVAWSACNSDGTTHRKGTLRPNMLWIYDMTGNVHEWCSDLYDSLSYSSSGVMDILPEKDIRVFRGGSWQSDSTHCRINNRNHAPAETRNFSLGFRLAEDVR